MRPRHRRGDTKGVSVSGLPRSPIFRRRSLRHRRLLEALTARGEFDSVAIGFPQSLAGNNASGTFAIVGRPGPVCQVQAS